VVELAQRHLCTDILAHRNERDAEHGKCLERIIYFRAVAILFPVFPGLVDMLVAVVQHCLYLEHVASACERTHLDKDLDLF